MAEVFAGEIADMINESAKNSKPYTISLSGGSTPELLFTILGEKYAEIIPWKFVHLFWGDERCVDPSDRESNYGMTLSKLISRIDIPLLNVHRIIGEKDPVIEASRYSEEIAKYTSERDNLPLFDLVILGMGEDGHTASIFPGHLDLLRSSKICDVTYHPITNQKRITMTGRVINNAENVTFLVAGKKKETVVEKILKNLAPAENYPASFIVPVYGRLSWYLDKQAGSLA